MTLAYQALLLVHILSSTLLFGTGLGTAFHGLAAFLRRDVRVTAVVARNVVIADWLFTTPAVVVQPVTGVWMATQAGIPLTTGWLAIAIALYVVVGACWLPVVWLQIRIRDLAIAADRDGVSLSPLCRRYAAWWFALGWPAFAGVMGIFYLMVFKPDL